MGLSPSSYAIDTTTAPPADDAGATIRTEAVHDDPSREDLLQRAAERAAARMTWESIVLSPTDPILGAKMLPRVAERRARFRTLVKVALSACVVFCVVATGASALSSGNPLQSASATTSLTKTAPATGIVPIEKLDHPTRPKATNHPSSVAVAGSAARPATARPFTGKRR